MSEKDIAKVIVHLQYKLKANFKSVPRRSIEL